MPLPNGSAGGDDRRRRAREAEREYLDALLDEGLRYTFPASDPVAIAVERLPARQDGGAAAKAAAAKSQERGNAR